MSDQLENIMVQLGTGRWNILHFITVGFGAAIPTPHGLASAFFSPKIDYACRPSADALPLSHNHTSPSCSYFTEDPVTGGFEEKECTEWDFDNSTFSSTVTSEYHLVCGREYLRAIYQSMYMFGVFMGSPINGFLADRYGRKPLVVCGSLMFTTIAICSVWLTNFSSLLAARFLVGLGHSTLLKTAYILALEVSAPRVRSAVGVAILMPWSVNTVIFSGVAYLIRDWRMLQLVMSLLGLLHIPGLWLMDESPRWLAVRGQHQRALSILKRAARWNKVTLPPDDELIAILKSGRDEVASSRTSLHKAMTTRIKEALANLAILFRTPRLCKITLICYLDYLVVAMVYFGLSLSGASLSGNVFVYMTLMGLVEMPPCVIVTYQVARLGRRVTTAMNFTISGAVVLALLFIPEDLKWLTVTLAMLGKMSISGAFNALNLFASELFPTEVRTRGINTSFMMSRMGAMASPFITDLLGSVYPWSPPVVFGVAALLAGLGAITLPETLGLALSDTVAHLESKEIATKTRGFLRLPTKDPEASKGKKVSIGDSEGHSLSILRREKDVQ